MRVNYRARSHTLLLLLAILGALILQACTTEPDIAVGATAPDFELPNALGEDVALRDYLGTQPVLLYFHMAYG